MAVFGVFLLEGWTQNGITREREEESGRGKRHREEEGQSFLGSTNKAQFKTGHMSGTLTEDALSLYFRVIPGLLRAPTSTLRSKSGHIGYQEKEEITGSQKNIGSAKSKTGQGSGTLAECALRALFRGLSPGRLYIKRDNSVTS